MSFVAVEASTARCSLRLPAQAPLAVEKSEIIIASGVPRLASPNDLLVCLSFVSKFQSFTVHPSDQLPRSLLDLAFVRVEIMVIFFLNGVFGKVPDYERLIATSFFRNNYSSVIGRELRISLNIDFCACCLAVDNVMTAFVAPCLNEY